MWTGPDSSVWSTRAVGGVRSRRSKMTLTSGRARYTSRTVRRGSSTSTVSTPTAMASTSARNRCARRSDAGELIGVASPGAAAT